MLMVENSDVDIILLNETRLKSVHTFKVPGFDCYRVDRERSRGGGVAILIRNNISHCQFKLPETKMIEAVAIMINVDAKPLLLVSAYCPKQGGEFKSDLDKLIAAASAVIVAGDLNAKHSFWNCKKSNKNGRTLLDLMSIREFNVEFPDKHTYYRKNASSTLDIALCKDVPSLTPLETLQQLSSDHLPVKFSLGGPVERADRTCLVSVSYTHLTLPTKA